MKQIKINKENAKKLCFYKDLTWFFLNSLIYWISVILIWNFIDYTDSYGGKYSFNFHPFVLLISVIIFAGYEIINYKVDKRRVETLVQEYDKNQLKTTYSIIVKHNESARIQVVNSVEITQDIWDKLFDFFSLSIDYGFGDSGYVHTFNYLQEQQAEEISKLIKPHSRLAIKLK